MQGVHQTNFGRVIQLKNDMVDKDFDINGNKALTKIQLNINNTQIVIGRTTNYSVKTS